MAVIANEVVITVKVKDAATSDLATLEAKFAASGAASGKGFSDEFSKSSGGGSGSKSILSGLFSNGASDIARDAEKAGGDAGKALTKGLGDTAADGAQSISQSMSKSLGQFLPEALSNPYVAGAAAAGIGLLTPFIGQAFGTMLVGGLGAGIAGMAIYGAMQSPKVKAVFDSFAKDAKSSLVEIGVPFQPVMEGIFNTAKGVLDKLTPVFKDAAASMAGPFKDFSETLEKAFDQPAVKDSIKDIASSFGLLLKAATPSLATSVAAVAKGISGVADAVAKNPQGLNDFILFLTTAVVDGLKFIAWLTSVASYLESQWAPLWQNIGGIVKGVWQIISDTTKTVLDIIIGLLKVFAALFTGNWTALWNAVKGIGIQVWNDMSNEFSVIWKGIAALAVAIWNEIVAGAKAAWNPIASFFSGLWGTITGGLKTAWNAVASFFTSTWGSITGGLKTAWNAVASFFTGVWNSITSGIKTAWNAVISFFKTTWSTISSTISTAYKAIESGLSTAWNAVKSTVTTVWNAISSFFKSWWAGETTVFTTAYKAIESGLSGAWNSVKSTASSIWGGIMSFFTNSVWGKLKSGFNDVVGAIGTEWAKLQNLWKTPVNFLIGTVYNHGVVPVWNNTLGAVGLTKLGTVPGLAGGGLVSQGTGPTADDVLVRVSKGEAVVSAATTRKIAPVLAAHGVPGFAAGGVPGGGVIADVGNAVGSAVGSVASGIGKIIGDATDIAKMTAAVTTGNSTAFSNALMAMVGGNGQNGGGAALVGQYVAKEPAYMVGKAISGAWNKIKSLWNKATAPPPAAEGGGGSATLNPTGSGATVQALMKSMAASVGWTGAEWTALNAVEEREAGYSLTAQNPSSGAYGLAQFINGASEYAQYGGNSTTAAGQITGMLNYIKQRYGDPIAAENHEVAYGWYDHGGWLKPGYTMAYNGTGAPERVVGPGQGGGVTLEISSSGNTTFDSMMLEWIRNNARIKGGGNVQKAFGN